MFDVSPVSRPVLNTVDPELAHRWLAETYTEHTPRVSGGRAGFRMQAASQVTSLFRIDELRHTMAVSADTEPFDTVAVARLRAGSYRVSGPRADVTCRPGDIVLANPFGMGRAEWDDFEIQVLTLDSGAVRTIAAELSGLAPERVRFELARPLDEELARYWARTVDHVAHHVLGNPAVAAAPLLRAEALRSLAVATTMAFPNTALQAILDPAAPAGGRGAPASLRRAVEFVDDHAAEDIGIAEIAAAARLGPRGLQAAFRRHRDQTPLEYLRRVRLERAHRDLLGADPARGDTVAAVAARWGFAHPGRFALAYHRVYGRSPSHTLRD